MKIIFTSCRNKQKTDMFILRRYVNIMILFTCTWQTLVESKQEDPKNGLVFHYPMMFESKRAPSGFLGMRGKKYISYGHYGLNRLPFEAAGTRDKKANKEIYDDFNDYIMDYNSMENNDDYLLPMDPQLSEFNILNNKLSSNSLSALEKLFQYNDKRAPPSGFVGMRGKKDNILNEYQAHTKRAPSGFLGLRGKREPSGNLVDAAKEVPFTNYLNTRGKTIDQRVAKNSLKENFITKDNWYGNELLATPSKRVPSGFLGLRGKKQPDLFSD